MSTPTPTPATTTTTLDHDKPPKRRAAMAGAFWMLARVVIVLPLLMPFWLLYALCVGAGSLAEFFEEVFNTLRERFKIAFAEDDTYVRIEEAWEERRDLRARVKTLEKWMQDNGRTEDIEP